MTATALIIAAPGSGHGKTLVTAGLAKALLKQGKKITLFKMGPDYLDPMFLGLATGLEVRQLDYWMHGKELIATELARASQCSDHILIEGMMGLFDGDYPVAQLARDFDIPVLIVADASAMAQTFGAVMLGLSLYDSNINVAAVLANKVGSARHGEMLQKSVRPGTKFLGWIQRSDPLAINERHLGIDIFTPQAAERAASEMSERLAPMLPNILWSKILWNKIVWNKSNWHHLTTPHTTKTEKIALQKPLQNHRIAIARDSAFCFLYAANVELLQTLGAKVSYFSPITDKTLPVCEAIYLPGGYPEKHLDALSNNATMLQDIREHIQHNKPCVAECGGMLYLLNSVEWKNEKFKMAGILQGHATVNKRLAGLGYQTMQGTSLRGHTFHYASVSNDNPASFARNNKNETGEAVYLKKNTIASFVHWYFPSDPSTVVRWFSKTIQ